jgi:hypothetical protein
MALAKTIIGVDQSQTAMKNKTQSHSNSNLDPKATIHCSLL